MSKVFFVPNVTLRSCELQDRSVTLAYITSYLELSCVLYPSYSILRAVHWAVS